MASYRSVPPVHPTTQRSPEPDDLCAGSIDGADHDSDRGRAPSPTALAVFAVSTAGSPAGFSRTVTLLLYVAFTLSPTLISSNRFALSSTSTVTSSPVAP